MTQEEKFAWLSGPMAIPMNDQPLPKGAIASAAYYPAIPGWVFPPYNSLMSASKASPPRLAVFARVELLPGESQTLELMLEPRVLANWDSDNAEW